MFRRRWSGLPADPVYPSKLSELGYFINDEDEIRSSEDPTCYSKFHMTKNPRWNDRHAFSMHRAVEEVVLSRLYDIGLKKVLLPLGTTDPASPHVPICVSPDLETKSRAVVVFGESSQAFGLRSYKVCVRRGGINKGSMVGFVKALQEQKSSSSDDSPPGVVLANLGELWWWPDGQRGLTFQARQGIPMSSAVHTERVYAKGENSIPRNKNAEEHVRYIFEEVLPKMVSKSAKLDIIAIGAGAEEVESYLNNDNVWAKVGGQLKSMVVMGGFYDFSRFVCEGFTTFMKERGRAYTLEDSPIDTPLAGPSGNPSCATFTRFGCPTYSAGENCNEIANISIEAEFYILKWLQTVALQGEGYKNEIFGGQDQNNSSDENETGDIQWVSSGVPSESDE